MAILGFNNVAGIAQGEKKEIKKANDQSTCMKKENHEKAKRDQNTQSCDETIPVEKRKQGKKR